MSRWLTAGNQPAGPLAVGRYSSSQSHSSGSASSYLVIPRRSSSLSKTSRNDSGVLATSTRTPSLSDSFYQIEVMKRRQPGIQVREQDPFLDDTTPGRNPATERHRVNNGYQLGPQLVVRWSSGSWDSLGLPGHSGSPLPNRRARMEPLQPFRSEANNGRLDSMDSTNVPVTFLSLRTSTSRPFIGGRSVSLLTSLSVSAEVSSTPSSKTPATAPLDVVILLDNIQQSVTPNLLTQVNMACSVLVTHLSHMHDRVALAHMDKKSPGGLRILAPLGFHPIHMIQAALNTFSQKQSDDERTITADIGVVMDRVFGMFTCSPRKAYSHVFFISATPPPHLSVPYIHRDPAIEFHTVGPHECQPLSIATSQAGWHICYTVGEFDTAPLETHFIRKISKVIGHLRTGLRPGSAVDLRLSILPEDGCQIEVVVDDRFLHVISLRPGETWSLRLPVRVPPAFQQYPQIQQNSISPQNPMITQMMSQINNVMAGYLPEETTQALVTVNAEYQHSLFPSTHTVILENTSTVIRRMHLNSGASQTSGTFSFPSFSQSSFSGSF